MFAASVCRQIKRKTLGKGSEERDQFTIEFGAFFVSNSNIIVFIGTNATIYLDDTLKPPVQLTSSQVSSYASLKLSSNSLTTRVKCRPSVSDGDDGGGDGENNDDEARQGDKRWRGSRARLAS